MGAKHAKWFVTSAKTTGWLRETELVPKTQGIIGALKETKFALELARRGKVPPPGPIHVAAEVDEARALYDLVKQQGRDGAAGIVQGEQALQRLEFEHTVHEDEPEGEAVKVAYYKGCLASLSAKELDTSTQALAPKLGIELDELEAVTCCGAGDIHEAEPDYYLHLNARILAYAEQTGAETLMTICNVCTLNLRQANCQLKNDDELRARVNTNLETVGVPPYNGTIEVKHLLWLIAEGDGYEQLKQVAHKGLKGLKVAPVLRLPDPAAVEDPRLRGSRPAVVARGDHRGLRRRADRLPGEDQVLRLPDHPGARGDRARRAGPADRAGDRGRRRRDGHAVPALPPVARRLAVEAERRPQEARASRLPPCRSCTSRS